MPPDKALALRKKMAALIGGAGVTATSLAGGHAAYADIVSFENPGPPFEFEWLPAPPYDPDFILWRPLDITQDRFQTTPGQYSSFFQFKNVYDDGTDREGINYLVGLDYPYAAVAGHSWLYGYYAVAALPAGSVIGPHLDFLGAGLGGVYHSDYFGDEWYLFIGDGQREFMGVSFDLSGNTHYGWIDVMWNPTEERFDAYAWAYEDVPDRPIIAGQTEGTIPEPGTLALFAVGALAAAVALRRRKKAAEAEEE